MWGGLRSGDLPSTHSFRHGLIRVNRDIDGDGGAMEVYTGHALLGMKAVHAVDFGSNTKGGCFHVIFKDITDLCTDWAPVLLG